MRALGSSSSLLISGRVLEISAGSGVELLRKVVVTGLYFYGYSEVAMKALKNVRG